MGTYKRVFVCQGECSEPPTKKHCSYLTCCQLVCNFVQDSVPGCTADKVNCFIKSENIVFNSMLTLCGIICHQVLDYSSQKGLEIGGIHD